MSEDLINELDEKINKFDEMANIHQKKRDKYNADTKRFA